MKANPTLTVDHYHPAQNYIMVIPEKISEKSDGGIILPESARGFLNEGLILKCGPDVDSIYQPGMHITFTQSSDYKVEMEDGQIFTIVMDTNVLLYRGTSVASLQEPIKKLEQLPEHFEGDVVKQIRRDSQAGFRPVPRRNS